MACLRTEGAVGIPRALYRPVPAAQRADAGRGRSFRRDVLLRARCPEGNRRRWLGRRVEASSLRLGVQGQASRPRRRVRSAPTLRAGVGKPAAADRLRHAAVPHPHQLDEQRQQDLRIRPGRPDGRNDARSTQVGVLGPRQTAAGRDPAIAHRAGGGVLLNRRAGPAGAGTRPALGCALRQPARLLHVRRRCGPTSRAHVYADAGAGETDPRAVRGPCRQSVPGNGCRGVDRLRDSRLVQRRAVR